MIQIIWDSGKQKIIGIEVIHENSKKEPGLQLDFKEKKVL